jgi:CHAT domain-containing protein
MLKFWIKNIRYLLLFIIVCISFNNIFSATPRAYLEIIAQGDSNLMMLNYDLARGYYQSARKTATNEYDQYLSDYKVGYSYIIENEKFLALAYFTDIQISFDFSSRQDSALYVLTELEMNRITEEVLRPSYNLTAVIGQINSLENYLSDWQKARAYYLIANIYFKRLYFNESIDYYKKSLGYSKHHDAWLKENTYYNLLRTYGTNDDVQNINDIGMFLLKQGTKYIDASEVYRSIGQSCFLQGNYIDARYQLRKSLKIASANKDTFNVIRDYISIGNTYILQNNLQMAELMYDSTEYYGTRFSNKVTQMGALVTRAFYYFMVNDVKKMHKYFRLATANIKSHDNNVTYRAMLLEYIAEFYLNSKEYQTALDSLDSFFRDTDSIPRDLLINKVTWQVYIALYTQKARLEYLMWKEKGADLESLRQSFEIYLELIQLTEKSFQRFLSNESRPIFLDKSRNACEDAFLCGFDLYQNQHNKHILSELFFIVEQSKANIFRANFQHNKSLKVSGIPEDLLQLELELKRQEIWLRYFLDDDINNEKDKEVEIKLRNELVHVVSQHDSLLKVFEEKYPRYYSSKYGYKKIKIEEVKEQLTEKQVVLDYFLTDNRMFVLAVRKENEKLLEIPVDSNFSKALTEYRKYIESVDVEPEITGHRAYYAQLSYHLYSKLIEPFHEIIKDKQLFIIPDRELNLIPFETLITDTVDLQNGCPNYLVFSNPVNVFYSIDQLFTAQKYISKESRFVGFAPIYLNKGAGHELDELPGAVKELETICNFFKGSSYFGGEARKQTFFDVSGHADIIHLALHTKLSDIKPLYSKLFFSNSISGVDTMFTYEILNKQLKSKLLVLSGCNTGFGELRYGDGVINLARSFIYSGIENVIVTQWAVADRSSSTLMSYFYEHLSQGCSVDIALQKAKIDFLDHEDPIKQHPYYWSGYISVGRPVIYKKGKWWFVCFSLFMISLTLFAYRYLKKRGGH